MSGYKDGYTTASETRQITTEAIIRKIEGQISSAALQGKLDTTLKVEPELYEVVGKHFNHRGFAVSLAQFDRCRMTLSWRNA